MKIETRKWKLRMPKNLALPYPIKILDNLRDGLPFPYTPMMLRRSFLRCFSRRNGYICFAIIADGNVIGSIGAFRQSNIHRQR